jgi:hypothetical protein
MAAVQRPLIWRLPDHWRDISLAERAGLYPALHLGLDRPVALRRFVDAVDLDEADLVIVADGVLSEEAFDLIGRTAGRVAVLPLGGLAPADLDRLVRLGAPLLAARDEGPLASRFPAPFDLAVAVARGVGARAAEDAAMVRRLAGLGFPSPGAASVRPGALVVVGDAAGILRIAPALARASRRHGAPMDIFLRDPAALNAGALGAPGVRLIADHALTLKGLEVAGAVACAFADEPLTSDRPALWVRSAILAAACVTAAAHPSLDGLAGLATIDDWDRGLDRAFAGLGARLQAAVAAQAMADRQTPARVALSWSASLARALASPIRASRPRPELLVLFDLAQDLDVLLPVLLAIQARSALTIRTAVSDWLQAESPRTLDRLAEAGFAPQIIDRQAASRGETPVLAGLAGVLVAADASVEAHKVGRALTDRAAAAGVPAFSVQHGFETLGLTYRDPEIGDVDFGARQVFVWGPIGDLPSWIAPRTRAAVVGLGDPKSPPVAAEVSWPRREGRDGDWAARVAVFENLHWERYDEPWRARFLADVAAAAAQAPDALFLLKPHHAGRWLTRRPLAVPRAANIVLVDPRLPQWEPFTAPALIAGADRVLTTPSTVAVDAARAGRPVALFAYGLDLSVYAPLTTLESAADVARFLSAPEAELLKAGESFLSRAVLPGAAAHRIAGAIEARLDETAAHGGRKSAMFSLAEPVN